MLMWFDGVRSTNVVESTRVRARLGKMPQVVEVISGNGNRPPRLPNVHAGFQAFRCYRQPLLLSLILEKPCLTGTGRDSVSDGSPYYFLASPQPCFEP